VRVDEAPEVFHVPSSEYVPTEPVEPLPGNENLPVPIPTVTEEPTIDPGVPLPFPDQVDGTAVSTPVSYNTYGEEPLDWSTSGLTTTIVSGGTGELAVLVSPHYSISLNQPALVSGIVTYSNGDDIADVGFVFEYIDSSSDRTLLGVTAGDYVITTGERGGPSVSFETERFEAGEGTIRAWATDTTGGPLGYAEADVYLMPDEQIDNTLRENPDHPPMTIEDALGPTELVMDGSFWETAEDPIYYMRAIRSTGGLAVTLGPYAVEMGIGVELQFGPFNGDGSRAAATDTSSAPLQTSNGIELLPGSHHAALTDLAITVDDWYWVMVKQLTNMSHAAYNFVLYGAGFIDANEAEAMPAMDAPELDFSTPAIVHPRNVLTALTADSNGDLAGTLYLPYEGMAYMVVNERTSETVIVRAVNETDVQTDAIGGVKIKAAVGDPVVVFRTSENAAPAIVGRFEVGVD
jgi:hypothetical protein